MGQLYENCITHDQILCVRGLLGPSFSSFLGPLWVRHKEPPQCAASSATRLRLNESKIASEQTGQVDKRPPLSNFKKKKKKERRLSRLLSTRRSFLASLS